MAENRFKYRITATDETAKGVKSAEKQMGGLTKATKAYGVAAGKAEKAGPGGRAGVAQVRGAMDQVRSATGRLLSTAPGVSRYTSILGDVHQAATKAASGMRDAAQSGSGLGSAIGGVAAAAGGAVGIVAALAASAVKLASGWAEGGAQLGRLSASLGVTTDDLQKFQAAGERFGVSKEETTGALGSLGSTMHEAKYGRNQLFAQLLNQLGLSMRMKSDGSVDASAEMLDLSDAIAKKTDPQTQARISDLSGVSSALPMLRQGRAAVQAAMDDAAKYAAMRTTDDVGVGTRQYSKGVALSQLGARAGLAAERGAALTAEPGLDASLSAGRDIADGISSGAAGRMAAGAASAGVAALGGASRWAGGEVKAFGGAVADAFGLVKRAAEAGEKRWGVPARVTEAQFNLESGHGRHMPTGSNNPFGIKAREGEPYVEAWTHENVGGHDTRVRARFRKFASLDEAVDAHDRLLATGRPYAGARGLTGNEDAYADAISGHYATDPRYAGKLKGALHALDTPVHVTLEITGLPAGAKVAARSKTGTAVAIGHAGVGSGSI